MERPVITEPDPKRRKFDRVSDIKRVTLLGTEVRSNGTISPFQVSQNDDMDLCFPENKKESSIIECSCGYLHGPGTSDHDKTAVGFSSNMMRGPD